jgi:hypothetical protein
MGIFTPFSISMTITSLLMQKIKFTKPFVKIVEGFRCQVSGVRKVFSETCLSNAVTRSSFSIKVNELDKN